MLLLPPADHSHSYALQKTLQHRRVLLWVFTLCITIGLITPFLWQPEWMSRQMAIIGALHQYLPSSTAIDDTCMSHLATSHQVLDRVQPSNKEFMVMANGSVDAKDAPWYWKGRMPEKGCWTYKDRYGEYLRLLDENKKTGNQSAELQAVGRINTCTPRAKTALLVRTKKTKLEPWSKDKLAHILSLVFEAGVGAGVHVYLVANVNLDEEGRRKWIEEEVPEWLKPITIAVSLEELRQDYPDGAINDILIHNHAIPMWFQKTYPHYTTIYAAEDDVRYIGRWDSLFASISSDYSSQAAQLPTPPEGFPHTPDLITFDVPGPIDPSWIWAQTLTQYPPEYARNCVGVFWGWSSRLFVAMDEALRTRGNAYFEAFTPTVANLWNLTSFYYEPTLYGRVESVVDETIDVVEVRREYDVFMGGKETPRGATYRVWESWKGEWYKLWMKDQEICRPTALLHPVKL